MPNVERLKGKWPRIIIKRVQEFSLLHNPKLWSFPSISESWPRKKVFCWWNLRDGLFNCRQQMKDFIQWIFHGRFIDFSDTGKVRGKLMKTRKNNSKPSSLWTFHLINTPSSHELNMIRLRLGWKTRGKTQNEFNFGSVNPHAWIYVFPCGGWSANDKVIELSYFPCGSSTWHDSSVYINFGFSAPVMKIRFDREKIRNRFFSEGNFPMS